MGGYISKIDEICESSLSEANQPSTPINLPKTKNLDLDPRSPTANIVRTPIQVVCDSSLSSTSPATPLDKPPPLADPRSPAEGFTRTPLTACNEKHPLKLKNKNLDKAKRASGISTPQPGPPQRPKDSFPRLLESSPVLRTSPGGRSVGVGYLETSFDVEEVSQATPEKLPQEVQQEHSLQNLSPEEIVRRDVETLRKLKQVVYEDLEQICSPMTTPSAALGRQPLGQMNGTPTHASAASQGKGKASSRIPVLRGSGLRSQMHCENTPPMPAAGLVKPPVKRCQWDPDNTMLI